MTNRPDTQTRILVASIAMIVVLSWITGCASVWALAERPLP